MILQKTLVALSVGAVLGVVSQSALAHSNLLPAIKVGAGWISVVSYINTQPPAAGGVFVHATHQSKDITALTDACIHVDVAVNGRSATTANDLTTTVLTTPGGASGSVLPEGDTIGGAIITPPTLAVPGSEGFLVLENYDGNHAVGVDGTLTSDAIVFNLASGFLFSTRGISTTHVLASPLGIVRAEAPGCVSCNNLNGNVGVYAPAVGVNNATTGILTRFAFLPPEAPASTGAYLIPTNRMSNLGGAGTDDALTTNLVAEGYRATARFEARMDFAQSFAQGIYDRLEGARSLSVTNDVVCVGQLSLAQISGNLVPGFIANGGWFNLSARAVVNATGTANLSDGAMAYKVVFAAGYGLSFEPLNQQWYAK